MPENSPGPSAQEMFDRLADRYIDHPTVESSRGFRATGILKIDRKIFAMLDEGRLVVKLPAGRVADLLARDEAEPWGTKPGQPMRQWAAFGYAADAERTWADAVAEAYEFVSGG